MVPMSLLGVALLGLLSIVLALPPLPSPSSDRPTNATTVTNALVATNASLAENTTAVANATILPILGIPLVPNDTTIAEVKAILDATGIKKDTLNATAAADANDPISFISEDEMHSFRPYAHFASAAYCLPITTVDWKCGKHCNAIPNFVPFTSGGDGIFTQFWFVGFNPDTDEIIVAHQGTDLLAIVPLLTDADFLPLPLDPQLFPGVSPFVLVHNGFALEQSITAPFILTAVKNAMAEFGTKKVTTVGHSLGAGIALLDAVFLHLQIPDAIVRFVGFGSPRVGWESFANFVDTLPIQVNHIANKKDLVIILPFLLLGYRHISGEIHIDELNRWINCPGHDNLSIFCTAGNVNLLLDFNLFDHGGPYDTVFMFCL